MARKITHRGKTRIIRDIHEDTNTRFEATYMGYHIMIYSDSDSGLALCITDVESGSYISDGYAKSLKIDKAILEALDIIAYEFAEPVNLDEIGRKRFLHLEDGEWKSFCVLENHGDHALITFKPMGASGGGGFVIEREWTVTREELADMSKYIMPNKFYK